ncbi:LPXTG cell wall anchor domain-containing protein, partial [Enterococcus spodopteracolus]|uniref:LPXTG cell wall anchor domain-containing protein n=1 Tax=Enterococcus spodopteracolus TaxID=3034501 RepID=UPI0026473399
ERKFTIEADEARALNQKDVTIDSSINWWIVAVISLIILLLLIIVWLLLKKKKNERDDSVNDNE